MLLVHLVQDLPSMMPALVSWVDVWHHAPLALHLDWATLQPLLDTASPSAPTFDTDVFRDVRSGFSNFISSGQIWALLIGIVIGYVLRGLTTYG